MSASEASYSGLNSGFTIAQWSKNNGSSVCLPLRIKLTFWSSLFLKLKIIEMVKYPAISRL
jgi:hypothetical protein